MFARLPEALEPLVFEVPPELVSHMDLLKQLGAGETASVARLVELLQVRMRMYADICCACSITNFTCASAFMSSSIAADPAAQDLIIAAATSRQAYAVQELGTSLQGCMLNVNGLHAVVCLLAGILRPTHASSFQSSGTHPDSPRESRPSMRLSSALCCMQELGTSLQGCALNVNELRAVVCLLAGISRPTDANSVRDLKRAQQRGQLVVPSASGTLAPLGACAHTHTAPGRLLVR